MLTLMSLIQSGPELTPEMLGANRERMIAQVNPQSGAAGRVFNRVADRSQKGIDYSRSDIELDAIAQFFFTDVSASMTAAATGKMDLAMGLPGNLIEELNPVLCLQNTIVFPPSDNTCLKRMSILRKRQDVSSEVFQEQWFNLHAVLAKRLPGVLGYRQNLVLDGPRDENGHFMVDGMVELWFRDEATIEAAFGSDAGSTLITHAREFIADITTFLVDPVLLDGTH